MNEMCEYLVNLFGVDSMDSDKKNKWLTIYMI
jgi:hypothetical protein